MGNSDRRRRILSGIVVALTILAGGCRHVHRTLEDNPELKPLDLGADFELVGPGGKPYSLSNLGGQVVILFFGYTSCPDVCPTTLGRLARTYRVLDSLGVSKAQVRTVFISVDPERDTPEVLEKYLGYFSIPVDGVTGSPDAVARVARDFRASFSRVESDSAGGYLMNHSTYLYLIDPLGRVRHLFNSQDSPEKIADLIEQVVAEGTCYTPRDGADGRQSG